MCGCVCVCSLVCVCVHVLMCVVCVDVSFVCLFYRTDSTSSLAINQGRKC